MYPWRRILIPTDFSTASEWVFDDAIRLAATTGAELIILHVRMTWSAHPSELRLPADPSVYAYAEGIELERLRDKVRRANAGVRTRLVVKQASEAGAEILRTAGEEDADLIVIATHARHHVAHLLIGSTTLSVLSNPAVPVLAIRYGIRKRPALRRLLVPAHPRQTSRAALDLAVAIASREGAEIHLLTVCGEGGRAEAEKLQAAIVQQLPPGISLQPAIAEGDVRREVIRFVERHEIDAVFLNASEQPGPVKVDIIRHLTAPVMIVPQPVSG
ncbi:MAG TPA: universal stress protein [Thermoanaerobaculia bacterium]|nr:universal stress protein [Thermoanaerobaculia bacterium]